MHRLHLEAAHGEAVSCLELLQVRDIQEPVLLQFHFHQRQGQRGGVNGGGDILQHIRQSADMILMSVGEDDAPDLVRILRQIGHIRDDHVHPVHIAIRETQAAVHHQDIVSVFVHSPSRARKRVASSANSRLLPTGIP